MTLYIQYTDNRTVYYEGITLMRAAELTAEPTVKWWWWGC